MNRTQSSYRGKHVFVGIDVPKRELHRYLCLSGRGGEALSPAGGTSCSGGLLSQAVSGRNPFFCV